MCRVVDSWYDHAACKGQTSRFFLQAFESLAKATCDGCPVRYECQQAGMRDDHGIWGGLTPEERERVRNKRKPSALRRAREAA